MSDYGPGPHVAVDLLAFGFVLTELYNKNNKHNPIKETPYILVIRRADGSWALPGGFVDPEKDQSVRDAAIREAIEETNILIDYPQFVMPIYPKNDKKRDHRGWIITFPFTYDCGDFNTAQDLPEVKAGDDAKFATWISLEDIDDYYWFADHKTIIKEFFRE